MKKTRILLPALLVTLGLVATGRLTAQTFTNLHNFNNVTDGDRPYASVVLSGNTLYGTTLYGFNYGTVFAVNTDGTGFTNLHAFANGGGINPNSSLIVSGNTLYGTTTYNNVFALTNGFTGIENVHAFTCATNDGCEPNAGVILSGNTLYGTTVDGGASGSGVVYSVNTNGSGIAVLHSFTGADSGADGGSPQCVLVLSGNTLYGTAYEGGGSGSGTVFAVNTAGTVFAVVHTFTGGTNGSFPSAGVILSGNTLYGTTVAGGTFEDGTVFKVNTDGSDFQTLHSFSGPYTDGYQPTDGGLVLSGNTLYGMTIQGGTGNEGTLYEINTDGLAYKVLYSFTPLTGGTNSDGAQPLGGLIISGNTLYGTATLGGTSDDGTVFRLTLPPAPTTIDPGNHYAYGANIGWTDWRGDVNHGAVIGEYVCSGSIYSANVGWINLGGGFPTNGIYYQNLSASDFGVNQDGSGNLRGYAWGANIGWLNFENTGAPEVNLQTGILSGCVWSANCGWISLSNAFAYVQTDTIMPGTDSTGDGIADAWALQYFGKINIPPNSDPENNGMTLLQDYLAGTNPNDSNDVFEITGVGYGIVTPGDTTLQWTSKPTRAYAVQESETLEDNSAWADVADYGLGANEATFKTGNTNGSEFYRIRAFRPLYP